MVLPLFLANLKNTWSMRACQTAIVNGRTLQPQSGLRCPSLVPRPSLGRHFIPPLRVEWNGGQQESLGINLEMPLHFGIASSRPAYMCVSSDVGSHDVHVIIMFCATIPTLACVMCVCSDQYILQM